MQLHILCPHSPQQPFFQTCSPSLFQAIQRNAGIFFALTENFLKGDLSVSRRTGRRWNVTHVHMFGMTNVPVAVLSPPGTGSEEGWDFLSVPSFLFECEKFMSYSSFPINGECITAHPMATKQTWHVLVRSNVGQKNSGRRRCSFFGTWGEMSEHRSLWERFKISTRIECLVFPDKLNEFWEIALNFHQRLSFLLLFLLSWWRSARPPCT